MKSLADGIQDLIQEAKLRTVWWMLCIFIVTYFLTHTSKSMLMNIPIAVLLVSGLRILFNEVEFQWKVRNARAGGSYLSHLDKKQLSVNDSRISTQPPSPQEWKRKIDSPLVEAAIEDFVNKALHEFVIDLWYSEITPDKEAPELIHAIIMEVLGDVSGRLKEVNIVELLTRDIVDLIGDHIDLFRRNQTAIGRDVMGTLSSEERDEKLKHHLMASKELHPALISSECEYKVIQQLMGGLLAVVLRPREARCPLVRCIARELLTCLVLQPLMNFASPVYVNELIEYIIILCTEWLKDLANAQSTSKAGHGSNQTVSGEYSSNNQGTGVPPSQFNDNRELELGASGNSLSSTTQDEAIHPRSAEWAKAFEAATQRRTEVLTPENLENMWTIGRNYRKDIQKKNASEFQAPDITSSVSAAFPIKDSGHEVPKQKQETSIKTEDKGSKDSRSSNLSFNAFSRSQDLENNVFSRRGSISNELENNASIVTRENNRKYRRSNSISEMEVRPKLQPIITVKMNDYMRISYHLCQCCLTIFCALTDLRSLILQVIGAFFEKLGSNSFAVYSIAVTDAENTTWCVNRRYRNFERLHRHLRDIPNYTLQLPPKRIFSSSTEDSFVHQRCIQLDKYLQGLLSIPNVAEQHEVWDFLSASSKNYSFGKSSSVITTLAVNVDGAMDDIVRQFKGVSDGLMRIVARSPSSTSEPPTSFTSRNVSWNTDDVNKLSMKQTISDSQNSFSDNEEGDKDINHEQQELENPSQVNGGHLDSELKEDLTGVPPEWTPPNLTVPVLNLVDNVFQLKRRGWLRRQVFWISKQILQLVMEDAIDDWLLRQIQWLRKEEAIAQGIRWLQDILWPGGRFFLTLRIQSKTSDNQSNQGSQTTSQQGGKTVNQPTSFEQQLEAARRASDVKKIIFDGTPAALVSLIGRKQYKRCARDIYYFLQSTICLKQLGYAILELVLITIFPELRELVRDIHEKMHMQHPQT
ncbi:phox domain-containing protein [Perilla frutescens var. hirtella]|uniref:Phox domain-containing protein n=1 Tax=Perilla frutescens var. hirtella TaxID=608512 RepID=A0AAD4IRD0_PERFH|nr:phox domain-containing protein [Perilla frutescens var. hirtella]